MGKELQKIWNVKVKMVHHKFRRRFYMEWLEYLERFLISKATVCGSISTVFSSILLLCVSIIIIIIIIIIMIIIITIIVIMIIIILILIIITIITTIMVSTTIF